MNIPLISRLFVESHRLFVFSPIITRPVLIICSFSLPETINPDGIIAAFYHIRTSSTIKYTPMKKPYSKIIFHKENLLRTAKIRSMERLPLRYYYIFWIYQPFTASFRAFPALNAGAVDAGIFTSAPVEGLRPVLSARSLVSKVPKPMIYTLSTFTMKHLQKNMPSHFK